MIEIFQKGGVLVWPIILCSVIGTTIFIERLFWYRHNLKRQKLINHLCGLLEKSDFFGAKKVLLDNTEPHQYCLSSVENLLTEAFNIKELNQDAVETVLMHGVDREVKLLSRYLGTLATLANISPLLGLLGTVIGMIKAFSVVEDMGGRVNASILAGGIWEAMLTTAFGLTVAILLIIFHSILVGHLNRLQSHLESVAIIYLKAWININYKEENP